MQEMMLVLVTVGKIDNAEQIAGALVEEHLAACVNIVPGIRSVYRWEGKVTGDNELLMLIKTTSDRFDELKERVLSLHAYDLPEIIGFRISKGLDAYLNWIGEETAGSDSQSAG